METVDYKGISLHRWSCGPSTFLARPQAGARLMNWNITMSDGSVRDVIYWPEDADLDRFAKVRGGNPLLFPFSGRTFNTGKIGEWKDQKGVVRPMPTHGFARDGDFEIVELHESGFTAKLVPDEIAQAAYPFEYSFTVRYEFSDISLRVYFSLENKGDTPFYGLPGIIFTSHSPGTRTLERKDYRYQIPAKKCFTHGPDGKLHPVAKGWDKDLSFGNPANTDRIYTKLTGDSARFGPNGGEEDIAVRILGDFDGASGYNAFVVWTEQQDSPFYCVEPLDGAAQCTRAQTRAPCSPCRRDLDLRRRSLAGVSQPL